MAAPGRTPFSSAGNAYSFDGPPDLAFEVRPLRGILSLLVDETAPDIDVADVDLLSLLTIELVEIGRIGGGWVLRWAGSETQNTGTPALLSAATVASIRLT